MPHEPHGFSASMIATGREPTHPPDVQQDAHASPTIDDPSDYIEDITQRLQLTHQQMASPAPPSVANPYQVGSLIYTMKTPPEHASKLSPRWKGPFRVCRIPNDFQVVYEDGEVQRTIHVNDAKPAKFTAPDLPEPVPAPETPCPPLGHLPAGLARPHPPPPPSCWAPSGSSGYSLPPTIPKATPSMRGATGRSITCSVLAYSKAPPPRHGLTRSPGSCCPSTPFLTSLTGSRPR